ncbi:CmcI family methyltransferase [uncultured Tateyamaria sp.]|uniref:cephalosporin hydroxylase family protein n=1 Tax=uncultured Tateyamaria sp. TaxID=455651 RepID=UPI00261AC278|nr:CmcI family methyltransferase [uncultured Tateyamaria sp.]
MIKSFQRDAIDRRKLMADDQALSQISKDWLNTSFKYKYGYNFSWMGQPVLKYPQDLMMLQMLIHRLRPDVVIETGVAYGGGLLFLASVLKMAVPDGRVIGVEKGVLPSTRDAVATGPLHGTIKVIEGDCVAAETIAAVKSEIRPGDKVLICLDSDHSKDHVLKELQAYAPMVSVDSYIVVFDTFIEHLDHPIEDRPFGPGNSPMQAVSTFLEQTEDFEIDGAVDAMLLVSEAPSGYLRRVK